MPLPTMEERRIHNNLLLRLDMTFKVGSDMYREIKRVARTYLFAGVIDRCESMSDLLERLQAAGTIKIGDYAELKAMLQTAQCNVDSAVEAINEAETEIQKMTKSTVHDVMSDDTAGVSDSPGKTAYTKSTDGASPPGPSLQKSQYTNARGLALIVNIFEDEREGSKYDSQRLEEFLKSVNCIVWQRTDSNREQFLQALQLCQQYLESSTGDQKCDYFVCAIMSHGDKDGIKTKDDQRVTMTEVMEHFRNDKLRGFVGRPKVFLVQACRGAAKQAGHDMADDDLYDDLPVMGKMPTDADFLLVNATTHGYKAWRRYEGSWFFQELLGLLEAHHTSEHLEEILITLRQRIAEKYVTSGGHKQMSCAWSTLTKRFYI